MRNYLIYILLILLSLSTSALSEEKVVLLTTGEVGDIVQVQAVPTDMEVLNSYPNGNEEIAILSDDMDDAAIYSKEFSSDNPPYIPAISYEGGYVSYVDSDWIEAQGINAFGESIHFLELDGDHVFDCQGLLKRMACLAPASLGKKKASLALDAVAKKGSDPVSCRYILNSTSRKIRCCEETSKETLEDSSLAPGGLLMQQKQLLSRIHFKAELSVIPALLLALR